MSPFVALELADGLLARDEGALKAFPRLEIPSPIVMEKESVQGVTARPAACTVGGLPHMVLPLPDRPRTR